MHDTYILQKTIDAIKQNNHKDQLVYIHIMTNEGKHKKRIPYVNYKLNEIVTILQSQTALHNIYFSECPASMIFDPFPYNIALYNTSRHLGVNFVPSLVGEVNLFKDGLHVLYKDRHLLVKSLAAGITGHNPHLYFKLQAPPHGPFGVWRHPYGSPNRPAPSWYWPPIGLFHHPHVIPKNAPPTFANIARAPRHHLRQQVIPLMGIKF